MGSPLSPVLSNIFMGIYESNWLNEYDLNKSNFFLRFIGEILAAFSNEQDSLVFNQNLRFQTYHRSSYTGLLLNLKSFISFSYEISLIKCLIDRSFKICNKRKSFHNDIENTKSNLIKNAYPLFWIDKVIKNYLDYKIFSNQNQLKNKSEVY